ncbi:NAD(P)-binding protein [Pseudovirgaria hyperparasitica]|uniref:NAD(P)-binding protein n=1 Tax=Pseudovirgaria hyperparasitica TaxID=470096 RepID=A0A6A6WCZ8_9PEZI|nr:NAD(P)-binding protein [Pseudovirgaria hyperparasitica]KAF2759840.1 NAD(P)-binding protein [Pseudovirgaria hyperparasitica]
MVSSLQPIIIGVGDIKNQSPKLEDALEPADLMVKAIETALSDTGIDQPSLQALRDAVDSIDVVQSWTWPYPDIVGTLYEKLNVTRGNGSMSNHGGNEPGKLLDEAARKVAGGRSKVAVITGAEALASLSAFAAAKKMPPPGWSKPAQNVESVFSPTNRDLGKHLGARHGIGNPIHIYPLYENGFRAIRKQSLQDNTTESAQLYADFAKVAEQQPYSWNYGKPAKTAEFIGTPSRKNRMICAPYPMLMNAFNTVNLSAAVILTTTEFAKSVGVPEEKWIYPLGGAGTADADEFWDRPNFFSSPAISRSLTTALEVSGLTKDDIDLYDFYSCFPIVPKLACEHLGLPKVNPPKPITLLGGLTSFGGAGNNYSMHAISEMVRQLRAKKGTTGLILANGGVLSYQHVVCLSSTPRVDGAAYPSKAPLSAHIDVPSPEVDEAADGAAVVETYTVEYNRDGTPGNGFVVGRVLDTGHRFIANHADEHTLRQLASDRVEPIGRTGRVFPDKETEGVNLFTFDATPKLSPQQSLSSTFTMPAATTTNILIIGGTGAIGKPITGAILDSKKDFGRVALFTSERTVKDKSDLLEPWKARGLELITGDITKDDDILDAYKGFDTVVSAVGRNVIDSQINLIRLAEQSSSINRFFPSEYGTDIEYFPHSNTEKPHQLKLKVRKYIKDNVKRLEYTYLVTGPYADFYIGRGPKDAGDFDVVAKEATLLGDGQGRISLTTMADVGKLLVAALKHPEESKNRALKVNSFTTSPAEILNEYVTQTGANWNSSLIPLEKLKATEEKAWADGDPKATVYTLRRIWTEGGTLYEERDNNKIEAPQMDNLETMVKMQIAQQSASGSTTT